MKSGACGRMTIEGALRYALERVPQMNADDKTPGQEPKLFDFSRHGARALPEVVLGEP